MTNDESEYTFSNLMSTKELKRTSKGKGVKTAKTKEINNKLLQCSQL